jgi:hypothetical protein
VASATRLGPFSSFDFIHGGSMVMSAGVPAPPSFLVRSLFSPGQLLLADRSAQELPEIRKWSEASKEDSAETNARLERDCCELIDATAPRVSCCLTEASMALTEKRIEDLCAHLVQASTILDELLAVVNPMPEAAPEPEVSSTVEFTPERVDVPSTRENELTSTIQVPRAMAAAA